MLFAVFSNGLGEEVTGETCLEMRYSQSGLCTGKMMQQSRLKLALNSRFAGIDDL